MAKRTFSLQQQLRLNTGGGIMDIPHLALLRHAEPRALVKTFTDSWGAPPEAVVLPVSTADGLLFRVEGLNEPISPYATGLSSDLKDFQETTHAFANMGLDIYLLVDPTLHFIDVDALHLIDIVGDGAAQLCVGNPRSQDVIAAIVGTGVDLVLETTKNTPGKLKGVVVDAVDLWPIGGKNQRLEPTCFCPSCEKYFEEKSPGLLREFKTFPNPWNLLLQITPTGVSHFNEVRLRATPHDIVGLSRQKGFDEVFPDRSLPFLIPLAEILLQYIEVRHNQTVAAIDGIFKQALEGLESSPRRIILTEGSYYDWTAGLQLERLDIKSYGNSEFPYDEIWFDPSSTELAMQSVPFRSYMWKRARYFVDAFFNTAASAADPVKRATTGIARMTIPATRALLRNRLNQAIGTAVTGYTALASLPDIKSEESSSQRIGFVGSALTRDLGERFIEGINIPPGLADILG